VGWLLSFVTGVLQRIAPFLASMHSAREGRRPALLSALTPARWQGAHTLCHLIALALLLFGVALDNALLVRVGALIGACGAGAFLVFLLGVLRRLRAHLAEG
jgi:hypothetical protein